VIHSSKRHYEIHWSGRAGWLRPAVLASNDAIVSTASLMVGVAASAASTHVTLIVGVSGLAAGAMSMAVGEYVSVSSQRDAEHADIERERKELARHPDAELEELAGIHAARGLDGDLAKAVAVQLTAHDALGAHLRDELGIEREALSRPVRAAGISAVSYAFFALIPILALLLAPPALRIATVATVSLGSLASLGAFGAHLGGARRGRAALRVTLGGGLAMAVTAAIGHVIGVSVG
jgi:VIT1/CCC1 family predicted Fe2+/Mn2+ transporter